MGIQRGLIVAAMCAGVAVASAASAQTSRCADCHVANPDAPGRNHLSEWDRSAHGRERVGCERCHGGNPATFEKPAAHAGMRSAVDGRSPIHRANLPATCGSCHIGQRAAFERTRHFQLLKSDDRRGSTCTTCHSDIGDTLLSPKALEAQCNACHGPGKTAPRPERAKEARVMLESVHETRVLLKEARDVIRQVADVQRRTRLVEEADTVALELTLAIEAGHAFVYDGLQKRVNNARSRLAGLFEHLTAPVPAGGKVVPKAGQPPR